MFGICDAAFYHRINDFECHYLVPVLILLSMSYFIMMIIKYYWHIYVHGYPIWTKDLGFVNLGNFGSAIAGLPGFFCPGTFF